MSTPLGWSRTWLAKQKAVCKLGLSRIPWKSNASAAGACTDSQQVVAPGTGNREELLRGMLNADLVGFHIFEYARHFLTCCKRLLGLEDEGHALAMKQGELEKAIRRARGELRERRGGHGEGARPRAAAKARRRADLLRAAEARAGPRAADGDGGGWRKASFVTLTIAVTTRQMRVVNPVIIKYIIVVCANTRSMSSLLLMNSDETSLTS